MRIEHSIEIEAPVEAVWPATLDVEAWPSTTPTMSWIRRLDTGPMRVGSQARVKQPGQRAKVWTVTELVPERRFAWRSRAFGTDMTGGHTLQSHGSRTTNTLAIDLTGRAAGLVGRLIGGQIRKALVKENTGLKHSVEAAFAAGSSARPDRALHPVEP
jgi:uncharacterized membrane protein